MHSKASREFVFHKLYDMAAMVEASSDVPSSIGELDWENHNVMSCLVRYNKSSLLHYYIYAMISVSDFEEFRHRGDLYEETECMRDQIENTLAAYGVEFIPYNICFASLDPGEKKDYTYFEWFLSNETSFIKLWEALK